MGAAFLRQLEREVGAVDGDDLGGAQRLQHLYADVAESAYADDDRVLAGQQMARCLLRSAVGGQARVGIGGDSLRSQALWQLDQRAFASEQELSVAAVRVDAGEAGVDGVHVVAAAAGDAMSAGDQRVADHRIAGFDRGDGGADRLDPAGVLVAHDVRQGDVDFLTPDAFDDVQIGAADAGSAYTHDYIGGLFDSGIGDRFVFDELFLRQSRIVGMQHSRFHS